MSAKRIFCVSIILFVKNIIFATISVEPIVIGLSGIFIEAFIAALFLTHRKLINSNCCQREVTKETCCNEFIS